MHIKQMQAMDMRHPHIGRLSVLMQMDKMRSDDIRGRWKQEDVLEAVLRRKKNWLRKIEDVPVERLAKTVYVCGRDARKEAKRESTEKMGG